jgi:hypothetical protein
MHIATIIFHQIENNRIFFVPPTFSRQEGTALAMETVAMASVPSFPRRLALFPQPETSLFFAFARDDASADVSDASERNTSTLPSQPPSPFFSQVAISANYRGVRWSGNSVR